MARKKKKSALPSKMGGSPVADEIRLPKRSGRRAQAAKSSKLASGHKKHRLKRHMPVGSGLHGYAANGKSFSSPSDYPPAGH